MKNRIARFVPAALCMFLAASALADDGGLIVSYGDRGISSLKFGSQELLASGEAELNERTVITTETHLEKQPLTVPQLSFDRSTNRFTDAYEWGTICSNYKVDGDRLFIDVEVNNSSKHAIRLIDLSLLKLKLPGWADKGKWESRWPLPMNNADDPQVLEINFDGGKLLYCGEEPGRAMGLHIRSSAEADEYSIVLRHEGHPAMGSLIGGDDTRHFLLSIRFGKKDASTARLADDIFKRFTERYPREQIWKDHRPIGSLNLSSSAMGLKKNPRGWFQDRTTTDVTTPEGVAAFHERLLKHADSCISFAKDMDAQGIIVWDIEGQEMPHMISYIGDPRMMEQLAPEMAGVADAFMKKFTDAGLRIGVTIRPSHVVKSAGARQALEHIQADDPVEEISEKIDYAKKRWGCTLFYIDSTVMWTNEADGGVSLKIMPAEYFRVLHDRFPDSLLIPEESSTRHWAYTAPYYELQHGYASTPASVRTCYPDSFSVLRVVDSGVDLVKKRHDELVAGVRAGDILLYRTWFDDEYDGLVKQIYRDAQETR